MRGSATPVETVERFRALYLVDGNASRCARLVGIPGQTGRDLAAEFMEEPGFVEARRKLRAKELEERIQDRNEVARLALRRFKSATGGIDVKRFGGEDGRQTVSITDKRHEYGKLILDAEKNAHALAKLESGVSDDQKPTEVVIRVTGPDGPGA